MTCGQSGVAMGNLWLLLAAGGVMAAVIGCLTLLNNRYTLNNIKSKTVGDGQHGTARWATDAEIRKAYALVPFQAASWRRGQRRPEVQGLVLGSISHKRGITALVDKDDVHCLMIGASGVGKTAYFLYPNLEYACASGMSFLALDTKGDLARNYGAIAEKYYGYHVSVVDLRNPTRSDGYNLMTLINHYMDAAQATGSLAARAKAEKYGWSLYEDNRSHMTNNILTRVPYSQYLTAKMAAVFVSGGIAIALPVTADLFASAMICPACIPRVTLPITGFCSGTAFLAKLYYTHPWLHAIIWCVIEFFWGGVAASLCIIVGHKVKHRFFVIATPLLLFLLLDFVL